MQVRSSASIEEVDHNNWPVNLSVMTSQNWPVAASICLLLRYILRLWKSEKNGYYSLIQLKCREYAGIDAVLYRSWPWELGWWGKSSIRWNNLLMVVINAKCWCCWLDNLLTRFPTIDIDPNWVSRKVLYRVKRIHLLESARIIRLNSFKRSYHELKRSVK